MDSQFLGVFSQRQAKRLGKEEDREVQVGLEFFIDFILVSFQVYLAERAGGQNEIGSVLTGTFQDLLIEFQGDIRVGGHKHSSAATDLHREVDVFGSKDCKEGIHHLRILFVIKSPVRAHDLASVVLGDFHSFQTDLGFRDYGLQAHVVDQDLKGMPHFDAQVVSEIVLFKSLVDFGLHDAVILENMIRLVEDGVAGAAGTDEVMAVGLGQSQISGRDDERDGFFGCHVVSCPAAVPILQF